MSQPPAYNATSLSATTNSKAGGATLPKLPRASDITSTLQDKEEELRLADEAEYHACLNEALTDMAAELLNPRSLIYKSGMHFSDRYRIDMFEVPEHPKYVRSFKDAVKRSLRDNGYDFHLNYESRYLYVTVELPKVKDTGNQGQKIKDAARNTQQVLSETHDLNAGAQGNNQDQEIGCLCVIV
jgi:hypothetical protein